MCRLCFSARLYCGSGGSGFNGGSSLAADGVAISAFLNTNTAAATAMVTWVAFDALRGRKPSAMGAAIGAVVGLVAITPCAGWVTVGQSVFISPDYHMLQSCGVVEGACHMLDDALDVFLHMVWVEYSAQCLPVISPMISLLPQEPDMISRMEFFWNHIIVLIMVFVYTFAASYLLYWIHQQGGSVASVTP